MRIHPLPRPFHAAAEPAEDDSQINSPEERRLYEDKEVAREAVTQAVIDYLVIFGRCLQHTANDLGDAEDRAEAQQLTDSQMALLAQQTAKDVAFGAIVVADSIFQREVFRQRYPNEQAAPGVPPAAITSSRRWRQQGSPFLARLGLGGRP